MIEVHVSFLGKVNSKLSFNLLFMHFLRFHVFYLLYTEDFNSKICEKDDLVDRLIHDMVVQVGLCLSVLRRVRSIFLFVRLSVCHACGQRFLMSGRASKYNFGPMFSVRLQFPMIILFFTKPSGFCSLISFTSLLSFLLFLLLLAALAVLMLEMWSRVFKCWWNISQLNRHS